MITGVNHITFSIRNLEESFAFYTHVLACRPVAKWAKGAYLLAGDMWLALSLDPEVRKTALPEFSHIAFTVSAKDFAALAQRIVHSGAMIWQENKSEGASLYFTDPNGHKLEIHASDLGARIKSLKEKPPQGLEIYI